MLRTREIASLWFTWLPALLAGPFAFAQVPQVAVLVEPGMVNYGGTPALPAHRVPEALGRCGILAVPLRADQAANPAILNPSRFTVLVVPYGNAFPLPAFENLRAFHRAGGCLVMTGVPFCHPCVPVAPAGWWADGGAEWGKDVVWLTEGHDGARAVRAENRGRQWAGVTSDRLPVAPGQKLRLSGWVRSRQNRANTDYLFVRFFAGGAFMGQVGPAVPPEAAEWTYVEKEVIVPEGANQMDVSLQVWSQGGAVDLDDVALTLSGDEGNLLSNPGFESAGGEWHDLGHDSRYFAHDDFGIGTGGFGGPPIIPGDLSAVYGNPLRFQNDYLASRRASLQWLEVGSIPPEDEVLPVVELRLAGGGTQVAAAVIRHNCGEFRGARDVWIGQVAGAMTGRDRYTAMQLLVRGVAWALQEKRKLSREEVLRVYARLAEQPQPKALPDALEIVNEPRPWGDTFFPKSKPPARTLLVVDVRGRSPWERLALTCLQALTAREQPRLWLIFRDHDRRWLEWHKEAGYIDGYDEVEDWRELFRRFAGAYRGAVVPDSGLYQGVLLACNLAALEDLIVAPPELARDLGIEIKIDLRGRFPTFAEGMAWLWHSYRDRFNHHLCAYAHPNLAFNGNLDYDMQWRGVIFWITGEKDGDQPGADPLAEMQVMAEIFAEMPPNIGMRGFPWAGEGIGLGEGGGVEFCGSYGKGLVCTDHTPNVSVMSGVEIGRLTPPQQPPHPPLQRDKIYIAFTMSDGDNLNTWCDYFADYFEHPAHGNFPIGWGMGPTILDLMPAVARWYYEHAKPGDEFLADVSGIAYVFPQTYASRYRRRWEVFDGFLQWTARYMERLGMRTVRPHGGDDDRMGRYAAGIPFLHSIFADYARRGGVGYDNGVYCLPSGLPVFHALTTWWAGGKEGLLREIRSQVGDRRPAFVNCFLHNWTFDMASLQALYDARDADMVFVTPAQLAALYLQAREKGWAK